MSIVLGINRLIGLFIDSLKQLGKGRILLWLLLYFVIDLLILEAHYYFTSPMLYGIMSVFYIADALWDYVCMDKSLS